MTRTLLITSLVAISGATVVSAQEPPAESELGAPQLAFVNLPAKGGAKLTVSSPAFKPGGDIPFENTQYRGNVFPGLSWTAGPPGTKSYAVIMQDADAIRSDMPILHWTMVNIPATITKLDAGMVDPPAGAQDGPNIRGPNHPYLGPHTPAGPKHRYHFQVFALDTTLPDALPTYDALIAAMTGHVLASGQVIGLGQVAPPAGSQE